MVNNYFATLVHLSYQQRNKACFLITGSLLFYYIPAHCASFLQKLLRAVCDERRRLTYWRGDARATEHPGCSSVGPMRTCTGDTTESDLSSLELESLRADLGQEEQLRCDVDVADSSSSGGSVDARSSTPLAVVRVISVDKTCVLVHPRSGLGDAAEGRKVGVAARFVAAAAVSTPCPSRPKSSDATAGRSRHSGHRGSRTSTITHPQSSTSSSSTSSSSGSVPDGYSRVARCLQPAVTSERDEQRLIANCLQLDDSQFYVAELSSTDAKRRLRCCTSGTFLVRDSAHPRHLYSLTVRTQRGITSIRTVYDVDGFRLDSDPEQVSAVLHQLVMPAMLLSKHVE